MRASVPEGVRVLVFGGTRGVGRLFVERALGEGHQVTVFARDPATLAGWRSPTMRVVKGDAKDQDAVVRAVPGHDAVVVSLGPDRRERFQRFIAPATAWMVQAMEAADVRRLLFMSALGVGESRSQSPPVMRWLVAPLLLRTTFADRADAEEIVRRSRLDWTLVRPLWLTGGAPTGRWRATRNGREVRRGIPRGDVAGFLVEELVRRDHVRQAVALETA